MKVIVPNRNIKTSLIDIKYLSREGVVEFALEPVVNLRKDLVKKSPIKLREANKETFVETKAKDPTIELASLLDNDFDFETELINFGGQVHSNFQHPKPRHKPIIKKRDSVEDLFKKVLPEIDRSGFQANLVEEYYYQPSQAIPATRYEVQPRTKLDTMSDLVRQGPTLYGLRMPSKKSLIWLAAILCGLGILSIGLKIKSNIIRSGNSAVINLEQAKTNLGGFELGKALANFSNAYDEFSKAGNNLNFMGGYLGGLIAEIPGNGQYKSARNLVEAGKLFSKAGESMASALGTIAKAGVLLNPNDSGAELVTDIKSAMLFSQANIHKASQLMADIDPSVIPEDKRSSFTDFQAKLPEILKLADQGTDYVRFLENFIAINGSKKYLILFQNPSELRPTGGFPGSYGILSFKDGKIENFKVDDVYNIDGQIKENIVPPKQLQHITPTWGMRDANWFIDFPTSARKIMQFFKKEANYDVDGVITFSPAIVGKILDITGPIELPEYNMTLDSSNFMEKIQAEVEYGQNRVQPKSILLVFAPKLLEKIYSAEPAKWLKIFDILVTSPEVKDMLMYFKDFSTQSFVTEKGFGGEVKNTSENVDYILPTFTNVKGSKTDTVIDNSMKLYISSEEGVIRHKLEITRKHNGGNAKYGFHNRVSPTYVRILVPEDADSIKVVGNDNESFKPLVNYANPEFVVDEDLSRFEASFKGDDQGVSIYEESGKKGIGFWLVLDPGETKTVEVSYETPMRNKEKYELYVQKQPGLVLDNFQTVLKRASGISVIDGIEISTSSLGDNQIIDYNLDKDLSIKAVLK